MPTTPADAVHVHDLAAALLGGPITLERTALALKVAAMRGYTAATEAEIARLQSQLGEPPPAVEFPLPTPESERHVRVVTGTGNAGERRELEALCRGLRSQP